MDRTGKNTEIPKASVNGERRHLETHEPRENKRMPPALGGAANPYRGIVDERGMLDLSPEERLQVHLFKKPLYNLTKLTNNYSEKLTFGEYIEREARAQIAPKPAAPPMMFDVEATEAAREFAEKGGIKQLAVLAEALKADGSERAITYHEALMRAKEGIDNLQGHMREKPFMAKDSLACTAALPGLLAQMQREAIKQGGASIALAEIVKAQEILDHSGLGDQCRMAWEAGNPSYRAR